ncbi:DEAD-box type RNA helicase [Mortierella polycephala]|uniref:DEAD-box type RNA helicase n=1 Tax=Mortierella polycephala TaxID=41804 RepID=A0A9P6Q4T8_9FUNG|nr:DEAD-box type RNA helicase [Mortierella polycephala]
MSDLLTATLNQMLNAKKMRIKSIVPGIWLLMLHADIGIQSWAISTNNIAASLDSLDMERWNSWEQFPVIWKMALDLSNGVQEGFKTALPLTSDSSRIWKVVYSMLSTMDSDVLRTTISSDNQSWSLLREQLLSTIRDSTKPPGVVYDVCRVMFLLLGKLNQDFWKVDNKFTLKNIDEAEQILWSIFKNSGLQDYIMAKLANKEGSAQEYTTWLAHFENSISVAFGRCKALMSMVDVILAFIGERMSPLNDHNQVEPGETESAQTMVLVRDPYEKLGTLEFDLTMLDSALQRLNEPAMLENMESATEVLVRHWGWLAPICALGPNVTATSGLSPIAGLRVHDLATRVSTFGSKIAFRLLEREVEIMWSNYATATASVKSEGTPQLKRANTIIWLRMAQTIRFLSNSNVGERLDEQSQLQLLEWQTRMIEIFSRLTLLPKMETRPRFSQGALRMCQTLNEELDIIFRADAILLQGFAAQGKEWLKRFLSSESKRFLVKLLKFWCSPDPESRTQALYIMRIAWQEVSRPACLRLAFQNGGDQSIEELQSILADFRDRDSPGGATPPALFQFLLDSVTTLFLNNPIDGEGGLYLQIFLELTSSQEVARHLSLIKSLWNSIWQSLLAAFTAGKTTWTDRQDRKETIRTMRIVADVGILIIGKIRYFERLFEFEKQDVDTDIQDQDSLYESDVPRQTTTTGKETMPLDAINDVLPRVTEWIFARDLSLCTSAFELVCAIIDLLAEHQKFVSGHTFSLLTAIAENTYKIETLLTMEQRERLWIALSRHDAYPTQSKPPPSLFDQAMQEAKPMESQPATIEISDDDFGDLNESELVDLDFDEEQEAFRRKDSIITPKKQTTLSNVSTATKVYSDYFSKVATTKSSGQTKLNFGASGLIGGIPAGGSSSVRRLPASLNRLRITSKPAPKATPAKKGSKLSQMRADHRRERQVMMGAPKPVPRPATTHISVSRRSDTESESESDSDDGNNGFSSLVDEEQKWNEKNAKDKAQTSEPRKTKLLELSEVIAPSKVIDSYAIRRQKALEDAQRQLRLTPSNSALHAQMLKWDVSATGERPPNGKEYSTVPSKFNSVEEYVKAFEPLLVLECWQQLISAREEANQSSDSVLASFVNRVSIDNYQDTHMNIPLDKASSLTVDDVVVVSDPDVKDIFTATGNAARARPFYARVHAITKAKGRCEVVFRTYLKIEESSALMFMRPQTTWSILKMMNLTPTHREYAALSAMRYYELRDDILDPPNVLHPKPSSETLQKIMDTYKVNTPQAQAIIGAIERPKGFTLIQGPPGTGKTKTILGLVGALLADGARLRSAPVVQSSRVADRELETGTVGRILVCAPSNAAIDEIVKRLKGGIRNTTGVIFTPKVVRVGTMDTMNAEVRDVALETLIAKELESSAESKDEFKSAAKSMADMREKMKRLQGDLEKARLELVQAKDTSNPMAIANAQAKIKSINKSKWQLGQDLDTTRSHQMEASQKKDQARRDARNKILGEADVICSTLSASGHDLLTSTNFTFETVIIDEAAQSVEISSLIPLKYGCKRCILVGDPNQLPPTVLSQLAANYAYNQSLFVRIQSLAPTSVHLLSIQYRMHPDISLFPSREFYKSLLKDGPEMALKTKAEWHRNPTTSPYRFFDIHEGREKIGLSHSQHNPTEAEAAVALLLGMCNSNPSLNFFRRVGVISPYKQQVRTLKDYFQRTFGREILEAVDFNTVDGFQGQEKDIIIFSCVRASHYGSVGFLADIRRMNVALTRARQSLFILGHANTLRREAIWGDLVKDAEERSLFTKMTPGLFGPRGAGMPRNILQPNASIDRRNELYGRVSDKREATVISQPTVVDATMYPSLPESNAGTRQTLQSRNNTLSRSRVGSQHPLPPTEKGPDPDVRKQVGPPLLPVGGHKRKQKESSDAESNRRSESYQRPVHGTDMHPASQTSDEPGRRPLPPQESTFGADTGTGACNMVGRPVQPSSDPPAPKRQRSGPSLFLKSKPMSMKLSGGPTRQYDVPTRERLAAQVIPIRKSYPSGTPRPPPPPPKRNTGPSIDDILGIMKQP